MDDFDDTGDDGMKTISQRKRRADFLKHLLGHWSESLVVQLQASQRPQKIWGIAITTNGLQRRAMLDVLFTEIFFILVHLD